MKTVWITRRLAEKSPFREALTHAPLAIVDIPLLAFEAVPFDAVPKADWLFFYSSNGVRFFLESEAGKQAHPYYKLACMGGGTAAALREQGLEPYFVGSGAPQEVAAQFFDVLQNEQVVFIHARQSRHSVQNWLQENTPRHPYRRGNATSPPEPETETSQNLVVYDNAVFTPLETPLAAPAILVVTSPLSWQGYQQTGLSMPEHILVMGNTTAQALQKDGVTDFFMPDESTEAALAKKVLELFT